MRRAHLRSRRRPGFTLIELLVVVAIIVLLMSLLMAAIMNVLTRMDDMKVNNDIDQMEQALAAFKQRYGRYPPSWIVLREDGNYNMGNQLEAESVLTLRSMFKGIQIPGNHDWNGDGQITTGTPWTLEGDECLVFFLGGVPIWDTNTNPWTLLGVNGFCADMATPAPLAGSPKYQSRIPSYLEIFKTPRLKMNGRPNQTFPVYVDIFEGRPYLYFAAGNAVVNNYFRHCPTANNAFNGTGITYDPYWEVAVPGGVRCYCLTTFQIVAAGRDGLYGKGGQVVKGQVGFLAQPDRDNITNFSNGKLENFND